MSQTVPIETAARDLQSLLEQLQLGETITLVGAQGAPEALLVSLKPALAEPPSVADWEAQWDALSQKIGQAWQSKKNALETLAEMRR